MPWLSCRTAARGYYTSNSVCVCVCADALGSVCVVYWRTRLGQRGESQSSTLTFVFEYSARSELSPVKGGAAAGLRISNIHTVVRRLSSALMVREPVLMIRDLIKLRWCDWGWLFETGGIQSIPQSYFNETSGKSLSVTRKLTWISLCLLFLSLCFQEEIPTKWNFNRV